jgi:hypothetical protein
LRNKSPSVDAHACLLVFRKSLFALVFSLFLAAELGVPIDDHIAFCIQALREHAAALGLRGPL